MENQIISGGISGAITDLNSIAARKSAKMDYERFRNSHDDVSKIAEYTGKSIDQILAIKNYLFVDEHCLFDGIRRFDEDFAISQSWLRLAHHQGDIKPHDLLLLEHELMEMKLIQQEGCSQSEAHDLAERTYNYQEASERYYKELAKKQSNRLENLPKSINSFDGTVD